MNYECGGQGNDAGGADEEFGGWGDFLPAGVFAGFSFEFGDGFDGVTGGQDFGIARIEFLLEVGGASEGAIGFFVEARGDGGDGVGQERIVCGVVGGDGEAGFEGGEEGEHGKNWSDGVME